MYSIVHMVSNAINSRPIMLKQTKQCPKIEVTIGVQCTFNFFSRISVLCLPFQNVYFLVTPFLYIVQSFTSWSSSFCLPFHLHEHHLLYQSVIFHSADVPK